MAILPATPDPPAGFAPLSMAKALANEYWIFEKEEKLHQFLMSGSLLCFVESSPGTTHQVDVEYWQTMGGKSSFQSGRILVHDQLLAVLVRDTDLLQVFPLYRMRQRLQPEPKSLQELPPNRDVPLAAPAKSRGGAPPRYDWDDIWAEICARIYINGLPEENGTGADYAPLVSEMLQWCEDTHHAQPSRSTMHAKVKAAVDRVRMRQST